MTSSWFSDARKLKKKTVAPQATVIPPAVTDHTNFAALLSQQANTQNMFTAAVAFMLPTMLGVQANMPVAQPHLPNALPLLVPPPNHNPTPPKPTATIVEQFTIPLADFCIRYSVTDTDQE